MSQRDQFDNLNNGNEDESATSEHYTSENREDIYNTPEVTGGLPDDVSIEETPVADVVVESTSSEKVVESAPAPYNYNSYNNTSYNSNPYNNQYGNNPYGQQAPNGGQGSYYNNNPYSGQYNNNPYNGQYNNNPYNGQYNNNPYNGQYNNNPYNGQYSNNPYNNQYSNNSNNNNPYNNQYGGSAYNNNQYNQYGNSPYGNNYYGGQAPPNSNQGGPYNNNPYNNAPYNNNNPYSPYAVPPRKNKNGLILGIVIAVIVLFLIAVFALVFRAMALFSRDNSRTRVDQNEYQFDYDDDDWGNRKNNDDTHDYDDDYDNWYDDYDDYYYDDDPDYYDLQDDLRWDLSYSVDFDEYEYDSDEGEVYILYPVITGDDVPNLDYLNEEIQDEVDFLKDVASDVDEGMLLDLSGTGYVTYMDEEKLSIVFYEIMYLYYDDGDMADMDYYLFSLNIDMENGVVLDNQSIINVNDDFSVDFRQRSDIQNGEINYLTMMSDQEITSHFTSSDIIVFYTPMGMEIGFNYDQGWVTVTYKDYEQYLKVF